MKNQRPKNLNLLTIRFPIPAIASILHRASGFVLFLAIPFILWGLSLSLDSQQGFDNLHQALSSVWIRFLIWAILSAFLYHFVAGLRHLLMDIGIGESRTGGKVSAILTIVIAAALIILAGIRLW